MPQQEVAGSSGTATAIKIAAIVVLLGAAAWFAFGRSAKEAQQDDSEASASTFICTAGGHTFRLTPARFEQMLNAGEVRRGGGREGGSGGLMVKCPVCGKYSGALASVCPKDQTVFAKLGPDGLVAACPKCKWKPSE